MEWQLRSLRSRTALALRETTDLRSFSQKARSAMVRSMTTYIGVLMITLLFFFFISFLQFFLPCFFISHSVFSFLIFSV